MPPPVAWCHPALAPDMACHAVTHPVTLSLMTSHNQPALNKKISDFCAPCPTGDHIFKINAVLILELHSIEYLQGFAF